MKPIPAECDVVVIGAGMGGLTAAALLAKSGLSVCVLEMSGRPGGYLAGFERKGFRFDTAIHWLNQCGPRGSVRRVFDFLAPGAPATEPLRRIRRYKGASFDYLLTDRPDELRDRLARDFPRDAAGVRDFFAVAKTLSGPLQRFPHLNRAWETRSWPERLRFALESARNGLPFARYANCKAERGLPRFFHDEGARKIFCSEQEILSCLVPISWAYAGDYQRPPTGGSQEFPAWLARVMSGWGATIHYGCRVTQILLDGRRAVGVRLERGDSPREIRSRYVIACCDVETLYEKALPKEMVPERRKAKLRNAELYDSSVTLSLGLDVTPEELGFNEELIQLTRDDAGLAAQNNGDPETTGISILAPSLRDPSLAPPGKGTLTLYAGANIRYGDFWKTEPGHKRGPAYEAFKERYANALLERVEASVAPHLRRHVEICEVATPITHWRYTGNRDGSIMAHLPTGKNIRSGIASYRTPVENLLLGGQWAEYGGGVPIAVGAGTNAALIVMKRERPEAFEAAKGVVDGEVDPREAQGPWRKAASADPTAAG